mmetsp:Transcript_13347/g.14768  ORF Transcript_13347/g.14768 Transcript_13347/m.14768 type:complete len:141 (-) Transcript_13347:496-918(-)
MLREFWRVFSQAYIMKIEHSVDITVQTSNTEILHYCSQHPKSILSIDNLFEEDQSHVPHSLKVPAVTIIISIGPKNFSQGLLSCPNINHRPQSKTPTSTHPKRVNINTPQNPTNHTQLTYPPPPAEPLAVSSKELSQYPS